MYILHQTQEPQIGFWIGCVRYRKNNSVNINRSMVTICRTRVGVQFKSARHL